MDDDLGNLVRARAQNACEYCQLHQRFSRLTFPIDHVVARQHGGKTLENNLALACTFCNLHKGPNIAGLDPQTGALTPLFNPRDNIWIEHFSWNGPRLVGLTHVGRTTLGVLAMNHPTQVAIRYTLINGQEFSR